MPAIKIFNHEIRVPRQKWLRILLGIALILGGLLGFLPIVGFWMLPLGLFVLSADLPVVRRFSQRVGLKWERWRQSKADKNQTGQG